ncbi:alanine racemase [Luteipulveratus mongoliensis]|uniref:Diaminopimelate decarboxylase n=1 Tax=Luteipulveratus mongoliensis TaxID=571913 RepID=A0A0K1JNE7_9MICO|nr:alanine racemase [Luteipulveratus mongoliensis]AKU18234.1 hypothetical protein VV02_24235 [Luteipulveratus mongoliensis]
MSAVLDLAAAIDEGELPCYIYDLDGLRARAEQVRRTLPPGVELYYAAKANPDAELLRTLADHVDGFETSSAGETAHVAQVVPHGRLAVGGPGKSKDDLTTAVRLGAHRVHVESVTELGRLAEVADTEGRVVDVLLRINPPEAPTGLDALPLAMGGRATPFGMELPDVERCLARLSGLTSLRLKGFHFHVASGLDPAGHAAVAASAIRTVAQLERDFRLAPGEVNLGGGMAVDYASVDGGFDWADWASRIGQLQVGERILRIEPGRAITAPCGHYVTEVLDVKESHGEEFVIVRGGTHHLRTPAARGHDQPAQVVPMSGSTEPRVHGQTAQLVGQLCTPKDVLSRHAPLQGAGLGDRVVLSMAGAYAWNISHHDFLMHPHPTVRYLSGA